MDQGNAGSQAPGPGGPENAPPPAQPLEHGLPPAQPHEQKSERVGPTRLSGAWTAAVVAIVLVVAMLIFILQNGREVPISFVSAHGHLPLGVALLFAAVIGALIVVGCGTARILQLRRVAKRRTRRAAIPAPGASPPGAKPLVDG